MHSEQPAVIKIDAREMNDLVTVRELLETTHAGDIQVVFKRVESQSVLEALRKLSQEASHTFFVQGYHFDSPAPVLHLASSHMKK